MLDKDGSTTVCLVRSPLALFSAVADWFLPPGEQDLVERVRARFFVGGSIAIATTIAVVMATYAAAPGMELGVVLLLVGLLVPLVAGPYLLRRGVSLTLLGSGLIVLIQSALAGSAVLDRGLHDVAFFWFVASPLFAALVGGARLAGLSVITTLLGGLGVLYLTETGYAFPELLDPVFARRYHVANLVAAAAVVAVFAWLYEGPLLSRTQALADRLRTTNGTLRHELAARRAAQDRAEAVSRAKDILLANLSHEFRTPLTTILCSLELLDVDASEDHRLLHETVNRGARRLLATLTGVLDLVEVESGGELAVEPVDVVAVARQAAGWSREAAAGKGLMMVLDTASPPRALADPDVLLRLLSLLVDNAVRFTETGSVSIHVAPAPEGVAVTVSDTGIGMPPAFVARATDPFTQASEGDTRTHEGLGLGLALAQRLARSMGGRLDLDSTPGKGTTVRLALPAEAAGAARPSRSVQPRPRRVGPPAPTATGASPPWAPLAEVLAA